MNSPAVRPHAYVLAVHDLVGTTAYFVDVLGFTKDWNDGDNWQAIIRDEVRIMLGRCPDAMAVAKLGDHNYFGFFSSDDVDGLHRDFVARSANILFEPIDRPWGWREMGVVTPEGHRMMFAQWIG
jgi:hypothetical protein